MVIIGEIINGGNKTYRILKEETLQVIEVSEEFISNMVSSQFNLILNASILHEPKIERQKYIAVIVDGTVYNNKCILGIIENVLIGIDYNGKIGVIPYSDKVIHLDKNRLVLPYMNVRHIVNILSKCKRTSESTTERYTGRFISNDTLKALCYKSPYSRYMEIRASLEGKLVTMHSYKLDNTDSKSITKQFGVLHNNNVPFTGMYSYNNSSVSKEEFAELICMTENSQALLRQPTNKSMSIRDKVYNSDKSVINKQIINLALEHVYGKDIEYFSNTLGKHEITVLTRVITKSGIKYKVLEHSNDIRGTCLVKTRTIESIYEQNKMYTNVICQLNRLTIYGLDGVYEYDMEEVYKEYNTQILEPSQIAIGHRMLGKEYVENINARGELLKIVGETNILRIDDRCTEILKGSIYISSKNLMLVIPKTVKKMSNVAISNTNLKQPLVIRVDRTGLLEPICANIMLYTDITLQVSGLSSKDIKVISKFIALAIANNHSIELIEGSESIKYKDIVKILKNISVDKLKSFNIFKLHTQKLNTTDSISAYMHKWNKYKSFIYNNIYSMADSQGKAFIDRFISSIDKKNLQLAL